MQYVLFFMHFFTVGADIARFKRAGKPRPYINSGRAMRAPTKNKQNYQPSVKPKSLVSSPFFNLNTL